MRISDWSSDVCSSDLQAGVADIDMAADHQRPPGDRPVAEAERPLLDRSEERRVGKECVVRVDLGGRRIIKKKKRKSTKKQQRSKQDNVYKNRYKPEQ